MRNPDWLAGVAVAVLALSAIAGAASGQVQDADQVKCGAIVAKDAAKVAANQGKINAACVKDGTKGDATPICPTTDPKGSLGTAQAKTVSDEMNNCTVKAPDFAYTDAATANGAAIHNERDLLVDLYGTSDLTTVVSTDKAIGSCQAAVTKDVEKVAASFQKDYAGCKKAALKGGATDVATIAGCVGADAKSKIAGAITKLDADAASKCAAVDLAAALPGRCSGASLGSLASCLGKRARCEMCEAINEADALGTDCDMVDDGAPNGSCALQTHSCQLAGGSALYLYAAAYSAPVVIPIVGNQISIGGVHAVGRCDLASFNAVNVVGLGTVCMAPAGGCPDGARYCGPGAPASGTALGVDVESDGNIGSCISNAACSNDCDVHCAGLGSAQLASGCVGYCTGSNPVDMACTTDSQCTTAGNGACNGQNHSTHANTCQCTCVNDGAFGGSDPGDVQCSLGVHMTVETAAPCDGTDTQIDLGTMCIPLTTQRAKGKIVDANFTAAATVPGAAPGPNANDRTGVPLACSTIDAGTTTGLEAVGAFSLFGTNTLGDMSFGVKAVCQ